MRVIWRKRGRGSGSAPSDSHHEVHEGHEVRRIFLVNPFVSFVFFVVNTARTAC